MMSARAAAQRAVFAQPLFGPGLRVVDVGCGPGSITLGASDSARRPGRSTVDFLTASAGSLPFADESMDVAFSHALFEHLANPLEALAELRRVLRPGGRLALSTSDWGKARLRPKTANVDAALRGHYLLLRRAGGDPFAGRKIADLCATAGFTAIQTKTRYREDLSYRDLAKYIESRLEEAIQNPDFARDRDQLASAARSAWTWVRSGDGDFSQCWTELTATRN